MKTKFKRFGKSSLSIVLSVLMIVSTVLVGGVGTIDANAVTGDSTSGYTFDNSLEQVYLYLDISKANGSSWNWQDGNAETWAYFHSGTSSAKLAKAELTSNDKCYRVRIPDGNYKAFQVLRISPSHPDGTDWNPWEKSGSNYKYLWKNGNDIKLPDFSTTTTDLIKFSDSNVTNGTWYSHYSWQIDQSEATISIADTTTAGVPFTVTSGITDVIPNVYGSSLYEVYDETGATKINSGVSGTDVTSTDSTSLNIESEGKYKIKVTVTYHPAGFPKVTTTAEIFSDVITVNADNSPRENVSVAAKYSDTGVSGSYAETTLPTVSLTYGETTITNQIADSKVTVEGSATVTAQESFTKDDDTYKFVNWVSTKGGTFDEAKSLSTKFYPSAGDQAVAQYTKCYTVTCSKSSGGKIAVDRSLVPIGGSLTVTATPDDLYEPGVLTISYNSTSSTASFTNREYTLSSMPAHNVTLSATFTKTYRRVYFYNRFNWSNLYYYTWKDSASGVQNADYPGVKMTKDTEHSGLYYCDVLISAGYDRCIFNSGKDTQGNFVQTDNITIGSGNEVFVPQFEEESTGGTWSTLEDYSKVTFDTDNVDTVKFYFKLHSLFTTTSGKLQLYYSKDMNTYDEGTWLKKLTRVYDYVDPDDSYKGQRDLYYFVVRKSGDSTSDMYKDIITDNGSGYIRIGNGGTFSNSGDENLSHTVRINIVKANVNQVVIPNGGTNSENKNGEGSVKRVNVKSWETGIDDLGYTEITNVDANSAVVFAKTGTIRDNFDKYSRMADIQSIVYSDDSNATDLTTSTGYPYTYKYYDANGTQQSTTRYREKIATVSKNRTFKVTVKIHDEFKNKYYVKAFCINGETYNIIDQDEAIKHKNSGTYTCEYTVGDLEDGPIEITPIYFYFVDNKDKDNYITFYVEDFAGEVKEKWNNTLAAYVYYSNTEALAQSDPNVYDGNTNKYYESTTKPTLGGYPGQPMVYEDGSYYMQVPKTLNGVPAMGVTLNNYVWDSVHAKDIMHLYNEPAVKAANCQTYDYDDFVALANITDSIIFSFKYRTAQNNVSMSDIYNYSDSNTAAVAGNTPNTNSVTLSSFSNGWNVLTDYYDYPVDLFANRLGEAYNTESKVEAAKNSNSSNLIYVVSDGYSTGAMDVIGKYGTKWYAYDYQGNYLGALPPSFFLGCTNVDETGDPTKNTFYSDGFLSYSDTAKTFKKSNSTIDSKTYTQAASDLFDKVKGKPVVITYETALFSAGKSAVTKNPGLRNDGRWYYSIAGSKIKADVKIQVVDSKGNIVQINGNDYDSFNANSHVGSLTGANAYFTNAGVAAPAIAMNDVTQSATKNFTFTADSYSIGSDGNTYVFRGWYLTTGGGLYNEINVGEDLYNVDGKRAMTSNATFVARYEKVEQEKLEENDTVTDRYLIVKHDLLSNSTDSYKPTVHNGTGTPYVTVEIYKTETSGETTTETILKTYKNVPGSNAVKVDSKYLSNEKYKIRVTVNTVTDTSTSWYDTYFDEGSSYTRTGLNPSNNAGSVDNTKITSAITSAKSSVDDKKMVYTYTVSELFGSSTDKIKTLKYYTDLSTSNITIKFKYFDRDMSTSNVPNTIMTNEKTVPVNGSVAKTKDESTTYSIANAIENAFGSLSATNNFDNVTDEYIISTSVANAHLNIEGLVNYHDSNKDNTYGDTYKNNLTALDYRFKWNGELLESPTNSDYWVSYKKIGDDTIYEYATDTNENLDSLAELADIEYVTVWCINRPKTYTVDLYMPNPKTKNYTETIWNASITENDGVYLFDKVYSSENTNVSSDSVVVNTPVSGFYNQRAGGHDKYNTDPTANTDANVAYLRAYGIEVGYTKGYDEPAKSISFTVDVSGTQTTKTYKFKGWYKKESNGTNTLVSTDRYYQNRITTNLVLYAGYELDTAVVSDEPGVTVTNNGVDYYYDQNGVKRVRLNTQLNVYNSPDTNKKIKRVAAIYLQLPVKDAMGNQITWNQSKLNSLQLDDDTKPADGQKGTVGYQIHEYIRSLDSDTTTVRTSATRTSATTIVFTLDNVEFSGNKVISYNYKAAWNDTYNANASDAAITTLLTNKNRVEFVMPMRADYYEGVYDDSGNHISGSNSALIAYSAIYYVPTKTVTDAETGETTEAVVDDIANAKWIISDNHVEYVYDLVLASNAPEGSQASIEEPLTQFDEDISEEAITINVFND